MQNFENKTIARASKKTESETTENAGNILQPSLSSRGKYKPQSEKSRYTITTQSDCKPNSQ